VSEQPMTLVRQLVRFTVSGGFAALVDFGILSALMAVGLNYTPAKAASWVVGTLTAYAINRRWTFGADASARRFVATMVLYGVTFAAQVGLFAVAYPFACARIENELLARVVAFVVAQGVASLINFIVQRRVIFRPAAGGRNGSEPPADPGQRPSHGDGDSHPGR